MADLKRQRETRYCLTCGTPFEVYPTHWRRYCCAVCQPPRTGRRASIETRERMQEAHRQRHAALTPIERASATAGILASNRARHESRPEIPVTCEQCGETRLFTTSQHRPPQRIRRFCNLACKHAYWRAHPELGPLYRDGTGVRRYLEYGRNWDEQAERARVRDGHACRDCGHRQRRPKLDVHHLTPRRAFAGNWDAANALDNLITLCRSCHMLRERGALVSP